MGMRNNGYAKRSGCDRRLYDDGPYGRNTCPFTGRLGQCSCGEKRCDLRPGCAHQEGDRPICKCCSDECKNLMKRLQKLDFSIQETVLYLDAYPDCCEAKQYYHHLLAERKEVAEKYQKICGPLTAWGNESATTWDWTNAPWPWHPDFSCHDKD